MRRPIWLPALTLLVAAEVALPAARPQRVTFRTDDGVALAATWHEPSRRPAPAVVLVHMLQRSRRDWEALGSRLAADGIGALAIDLRGHGESPAAGDPAAGYAAMVQDVRAARRFLAQRGDVLPGSIGVAGASLGANLAALAAGDGGFASMALLSPSLDYRGLRIEAAVRKYTRPLLLVASDDDPYARRSVTDLQKTGAGREVLSLVGAGHGTNMLSRSYELADVLVEFFRRTLQ